MEEILLNYQGIIGAITGTVLGTVSTLITTHILRNYGKVETTIFDIDFEKHDADPLNSHEGIRLNFKVKFYNMSESSKVLDDFEIIFLNDKNVELLRIVPNDLDTFRTSQYSRHIDKLYFVNLSPKQLTLKKIGVYVSDKEIEDLDSIKVIKLKYFNKRNKKHVIYKK